MKTSQNQLQKYRSKIDQIDAKILNLISQRLKTVVLIGKYKKKMQLEAFQPKRENELIKQRLLLGKKLKIPSNLTKNIFSQILVHARSLQGKKHS